MEMMVHGHGLMPPQGAGDAPLRICRMT